MSSTKKLKKSWKSIGIFGTGGAGKTTFLISLINEMYNYAVSDKWELNIAGNSHKFYIEKIKELESGNWLESTREQSEFDIKLVHGTSGAELHLHTADIVGESFQATFDPCETPKEDTLLEIFEKCSGYLFIIDPGKFLHSGDKIEEISISEAHSGLKTGV